MALPSLARRTLAICAVALTGCSSGTDPEERLDLETARSRWLAAGVRDYTFEYATATVVLPGPSGFYRVDVRDGSAVSARYVDTGAVVPASTALTVDGIWARILAARAAGEPVTSLRFDRRGVPLQAMVGSFANDGGVHYSVRRFTRW